MQTVSEVEQQHREVVEAEGKAQANVDSLWNRFTFLRVRAASGTASTEEREELATVTATHKEAVATQRECRRLLKVVGNDLQVARQNAQATIASMEAAHRQNIQQWARTVLAVEQSGLHMAVARLAVLTVLAEGKPMHHATPSMAVNAMRDGFESRVAAAHFNIINQVEGV